MRNNVLDFYRIIFTIIICLHHFQGMLDNKIIETGYIGVEFFFILSGFFLYQSYKKNKDDSAVDYTVKKLKRLYPEYIVAFVLCFILQIVKKSENDIVSYIFKAIPEITLIQNIGIFKGGFNYPLWYLSVLIFGGYLIFGLLKRNEKLFKKVISPITIIFTFSLLNSAGKGLENWDTIYGIYMPLLRGIADISIGVLLANFVESKYFDVLKRNKGLFYIIEIFSYLCLTYIIIFNSKFEMYSIFFIAIIICSANNINSLSYKLFNRKVFGKIGKITYSMYLNHASFIMIVSYLYKKILYKNVSAFLIIGIYFITLILYAVVSNKIINRICDNYKKQCELEKEKI